MEHKHLNILIIGGVAAGASCAARARRLSETASITLIERGPDVSFANCGLPYHIGGEIAARDTLKVHTGQTLHNMLNIGVRTLAEAVDIDRKGKLVAVRSASTEEIDWLPYDKLLLAPGAFPVRPPLPGIDDPRILTLRNLQDMDRIKTATASAKKAVVIGAGFIGLEMAEQLHKLGIEVSLVEMLPQVLPQMDAPMTMLLADELRKNGIDLHLGDGIESFAPEGEKLACKLASGKTLAADFAILSIGVRPEARLAAKARLELGTRGHIKVNKFMQTSDPDIYAAGDAVETFDRITGSAAAVPLGGPANRQGRLAADHMINPASARPYPGSQGTAIVRAFGVAAGLTGWTRKRLEAADIPFLSMTVNDNNHAGYYPGASQLTLNILWSPVDGRILGAQATGGEGVDKRLDVLATAIAGKLGIEDLAQLELSYAPPFGSAKDVINIAGMAALNYTDGLLNPVRELPEDASVQIVDVRPKPLFDADPTPGAINIPFPMLRAQLDKLDRSRAVVTVCALGKTSYFAARILAQNGFDVQSLSGGIMATRNPRAAYKLPS
ncbi:MAG: FAD-dependent oxidoreductase [Opitutales bacterium]|jgi:NADPH-dependent 2,4-dienoyl-CoA reductase/sulfur reductase-like enzyme/rhodanese-related sulfurtransferase